MSRDGDRIQRYLRSMAQEQPDAALAARVIEAHLRRRRRRRGVLALAASALLGVSGWRTLQPTADAPTATPASLPSPAWVEVRALDRRLQAGYLAGASDAELSRLWQRREEALAARHRSTASRTELQL